MEFIRGDTFPFRFKIKMKNGAILKGEDIETLFISVRKYATETSPLIFQKKLEDVEIDEEGYCHAKFNPKDTEELDYGAYFADVEITLKSGYRKTLIFEFTINKEATIHGRGGSSGL